MDDVSSFRSRLADAADSIARWHVIRGAGDALDRQAVDGLLEVLEREAPDLGETDERAIAAWSLGRLGFAAFADRIPTFGNSIGKSSLHRAGIADALGETRNPQALELLVAILLADLDRDVWLNGTLALSKLGKPALQSLEMLAASTPLEQRLMLLDAIHKIGGSEGKATFDRVRGMLTIDEASQAASFLSKYSF
jgi:HEAT repeat protein